MKLIRHKRAKSSTRQVTGNELNLHLFAKIHEELQEVYDANFQDPEEYADVLQAVYDLATVNNLNLQDILKVQRVKVKEYGHFRMGYLKS